MTTRATIPSGLWPHFQEYDPQQLDPDQDADLIIQASWTTIKRFLERQAMEAGRKNLEDLWSG